MVNIYFPFCVVSYLKYFLKLVLLVKSEKIVFELFDEKSENQFPTQFNFKVKLSLILRRKNNFNNTEFQKEVLFYFVNYRTYENTISYTVSSLERTSRGHLLCRLNYSRKNRIHPILDLLRYCDFFLLLFFF